MPSKAEMKRIAGKQKPKIRKGDEVMIITGKDLGEKGYIWSINAEKNTAIVLQANEENEDEPLPLNAVTKHRKAKYQGEKSARVRLPAPINLSNLMVLDPETDEPTKIGRRREDGKLVRYAKKSGKTIVDGPIMQEKD